MCTEDVNDLATATFLPRGASAKRSLGNYDADGDDVDDVVYCREPDYQLLAQRERDSSNKIKVLHQKRAATD